MGRFDYVQYDESAAKLQGLFKEICQNLEASINQLGTGRAQALALTALEECYMWIGKAIRDEQIKRDEGAQFRKGTV